MARKRLLAIVGALGLAAGLISSGLAAQAADNEPASLDALISTWSSSTKNVCISNGAPVATVGGVCTITQLASDEDNVAICVQNNVPGGGSCVISQTNTTEDNRAIVLQRNSQSGGTSQDATQDVRITQINGSARNDAWVGQIANQSTNSAGTQIQTLQQFDTIDQTASTGSQKVLLGQLTSQRENSSTAATQDQFSNQDVSESGGSTHHINQTSTGLSEIFVGQAQIQTATGSGSQDQIVDPRCCSNQTGNPNDRFSITQFVLQRGNAPKDKDPQDATSVAECHTDGNCTTFQSTTNNTNSTTNSCSGKDCVAVVHCGSAVEGGCSQTSVQCTSECTVPPPPPVCPFGCGGFALLKSGASATAPISSPKANGGSRSAPRTALLT